VAVCLLSVVPALADYWDGLTAYDDGNYEKAFREWRPAAEAGDAWAQNDLGWLYEHGEGVAQDYAEAAKWYRLAAEQGDAYAQNNLGWLYEQGQGVSRDYAEAVKWYRLAALQGHESAQENLGYMYEHGLGVRRDEAEAAKWYRRPDEQEAAEASECLDGRGTAQARRLHNRCSYPINAIVCCAGQGRMASCQTSRFEAVHLAGNANKVVGTCSGWIIFDACKLPYRILWNRWDPRMNSVWRGPCVADME